MISALSCELIVYFRYLGIKKPAFACGFLELGVVIFLPQPTRANWSRSGGG